MKSTFEIVRDVLADILTIMPEDIKPDSSIINDMGADSLDKIDIIISLEKKFNILIPDDFEYNLVQDLINYIDNE